MTVERTVKVAVVGSGLAGLTAAYLLSKVPTMNDVQYEVHIFEKTPSLGMDAHSVSLSIPGSKCEWRVDVPMRSFQGGYYRQLISLYKRLGVSFRQADFSYSFSSASLDKMGGPNIETKMIYNGDSGRAGVSMPFAMRERSLHTKSTSLSRVVNRIVSFSVFAFLSLQLLVNYMLLITLAAPFTRSTCISRMTLSQWSEFSTPKGYLARLTRLDASWREFVNSVVVPLFSAVCTASETDVLQHPVEEFLDYIWLTLFTHHYLVVNGVRDVVSRLTASLRHIHLSSPICEMYPDPDNSMLISLLCNGLDGDKHVYPGFSHVIFATQANHAIPILSSYHQSLPHNSIQKKFVGEQIQCLKAFQYKQTIVVNHTDDSVMPENQSDRRDLNLVCMSDCPRDSKLSSAWDQVSDICMPASYTMATHVLSQPTSHSLRLPAVYQTTNPIIPPKQDRILSVARLERAVLSLDAKEALKGLYVAMTRRRKWWQCETQIQCKLGPLQGAPVSYGPGTSEGAMARSAPGIWFCGSYAHCGIPLLEGCVVSATNVVEQGILSRTTTEGMAAKVA